MPQIYGTASQREAGSRLVYEAVQKAIQSCMKSRGHDYAFGDFDGMPGTAVSQLTVGGLISFAPVDNESFGIADRFAIRAARVGTPPTNAAFEKLTSDADRAAYENDLTGCQGAGNEFQADNAPAGFGVLAGGLTTELAKVEASPDLQKLISAYPSCMKGAGYETTGLDDTITMIMNALPPYPTAPTDVHNDPAWRAAAELEQAVSAADSQCRQTMHDAALAAALPTLQAFQDDHASELSALSDQWAALETATSLPAGG